MSPKVAVEGFLVGGRIVETSVLLMDISELNTSGMRLH